MLCGLIRPLSWNTMYLGVQVQIQQTFPKHAYELDIMMVL